MPSYMDLALKAAAATMDRDERDALRAALVEAVEAMTWAREVVRNLGLDSTKLDAAIAKAEKVMGTHDR